MFHSHSIVRSVEIITNTKLSIHCAWCFDKDLYCQDNLLRILFKGVLIERMSIFSKPRSIIFFHIERKSCLVIVAKVHNSVQQSCLHICRKKDDGR